MKKLFRIIPAIIAASLLPLGAVMAEGEISEYDDELVTFIVQTDYTPAALVKAQTKTRGILRSSAYTDVLVEQTAKNVEIKNEEIRDKLAQELGADTSDSLIYTRADSGFTITCRRGDIEKIRAAEAVIAVYENTELYTVPDNEESDAEPSNPVSTTTEYKGQGTLIAVIDSGFQEDHPYFAAAPDSPKLSEEAANAKISSIGRGRYVNAKLPFVYSYAMGTDTKAALLRDPEHGTHVAGIAAGKNGTFDYNGGSATINGAAPEAQLALMACSSQKDGSLQSQYIKAAIDDAVALDADVINMSLGSPYIDIRATETDDVKASITNARKAGVVVCVSQGNSSRGFYNSTPGVSDIDYGASGRYGNYTDSFSVASADTPQFFDVLVKLVTGDGANISGKPVTADKGVKAFADIITAATGYVDCGTGLTADFTGKDVNGKIALIKRGGITFADKTANAAKAKAKAVIIYDNIDEPHPAVSGFSIPGIFISQEDGIKLRNAENKTIYADGKDIFNVTNNTSPNKPSSFSSWGFSETMQLTPNITAYGGRVFSAAPGGTYQSLSGTSMSSPFIAGVSACMKSYLNENSAGLSGSAAVDRICQLLMTSAIPIRYSENDTVTYSPRLQGAGMVSLDNAIKAPVVLYNSSGKTLVNLGDNIGSSFTLSFTAKNLTDTDVTFDKADVTVTTDAAEGGMVSGTQKLTAAPSAAPVTVPANGTAEVSISVALDSSELAEIASTFTNGFYIDGFVKLSNDEYYAGIPFSGFHGDWGRVPVWDSTIYDEGGSKLIYMNGNTVLDGTYLVTKAGSRTEVLAKSSAEPYAIISPANADGYYDNISAIFAARRSLNGITLKLMQNQKTAQSRKVTGIRHRYIRYTYALASSNAQKQMLAGLPEGDYTFRITGYFDKGSGDKTAQNLDFPLTITIDNTPPEISMELGSDYSYLIVKAEDANYIRSITVNYKDTSGNAQTQTQSFDSTKTSESHTFTLTDANPWTISVTAADYAYNSGTSEEYAMTAGDGENVATAFKKTISGVSTSTYTGISGTVTSGDVTKLFNADFDTALTPSGGDVLIGVIVEGLYDNRATAEFDLR